MIWLITVHAARRGRDRGTVEHVDRLGLRLSKPLRQRVDQAGDVSPVARALLILGLAASGVDISQFLDEASTALSGIQDPQIKAALRRVLFNTGSTAVEHTRPTASEPAAVEEESTFEDPFGGIGIEV